MGEISLPIHVHRGAQQELLDLHGPVYSSHCHLCGPGGSQPLPHWHDGDQPEVRQGLLHQAGAGVCPGAPASHQPHTPTLNKFVSSSRTRSDRDGKIRVKIPSHFFYSMNIDSGLRTYSNHFLVPLPSWVIDSNPFS